MIAETDEMKSSLSYWDREEWTHSPDVLIIGGGITGASTAFFYKQRFPEREVLITDRGGKPEGASTKNAGFACIGSVSEHLADMALADQDTVFHRIERRWNGLQLLRTVLGDKEIAYENTGGYEIFTDRTMFTRCADHISLFNRELEKRTGGENIYTDTTYQGYPAIGNRAEGAINSGALMRSLHYRIARLGVRTWWNSEVVSVTSGNVRFSNGTELHPRITVLALNGFVSRLTDLPVQPARGYILVTKPVPGLPWRGTFHYNSGYVYFRNIGNRLLLGGGRHVAREEETTMDFGINPVVKQYLIEFAGKVLRLPEVDVDIEWSGIMGMTGDKEPVIRETEPGVWAAAGLSGMGIAIGMQLAKELTDRLD